MNERKRIKVISKTMGAVVSVVITKHLEDIEKETGYKIHGLKALHPKIGDHEIPPEYIDANGMVQVGGGSGFIVSPDGLVLTNKHVIGEPGTDYSIVLADETKYAASVVCRDPINDIAILKIEGKKFPYLKLGDARTLKLGQDILAIGNALGIFRNTVSAGIISGLSRNVSAKTDDGATATRQEMHGLIQTDAPINPGNSGGPLVNENGEAVGINVAVVSGAHSIGLAIPINAAVRDLEDVKKYGRIRRPYLGVLHIPINTDVAEKLHLPVSYGALIMRESSRPHAVIPRSPADKAGLRENDIILEINGAKLSPDMSVQEHLDVASVGDTMILKILRGDESLEVGAVLEERK